VFAGLDPAVQRLVAITQTLYQGNWDDCAEDLRRRDGGQPYLYQLKIDLDDAPGWLARLKSYEQARGERFPAVVREIDQYEKKDLH
jgi:hypothetical protein